MYLQCPFCNAQRFYLDTKEATTFFSVDETGAAQEVSSTAETITLTPDTIIFCSCCSWNGTVQELIDANQKQAH